MIYLPNTCPENRKHHTHLRLLSRVLPEAEGAAGWEGRLLWPGARLPVEELGQRPVLLEFAGPQGSWRRGKHREHLYILWRYETEKREWVEIARARSIDWSWSRVLRGAAIRALAVPAPALIDVAVRGREIADKLLETIDGTVAAERVEVRAVALNAVYEGLAGRVAQGVAMVRGC